MEADSSEADERAANESGAGASKFAAETDEDWKARAQREKEQLAGADDEPLEEVPPASFFALLEELSVRALFALGQIPDPRTGTPHLDLPSAKYVVDMLSVLAAKTQGNLDTEEDEHLKEVLHHLQLAFVEISATAPPPRVEDPPAPGAAGSIIV
jgi:hypothetical protein